MIKLGYWVWFVYYLLRTYILLVSETSEFCFAKNGSDIFIELCLFYFLIITNASDYRLYNLCGLCTVNANLKVIMMQIYNLYGYSTSNLKSLLSRSYDVFPYIRIQKLHRKLKALKRVTPLIG